MVGAQPRLKILVLAVSALMPLTAYAFLIGVLPDSWAILFSLIATPLLFVASLFGFLIGISFGIYERKWTLPQFLGLESDDRGSPLTGPINRAVIYDESGRVAGRTEETAAAFRRRFFSTADGADYCVRLQSVKWLWGHYYVVRGECEFPQYYPKEWQ